MNKNKPSRSAVHVSTSKRVILKIGTEKKSKAIISIVHVSISKLKTKPKISSAHCTKLGLPVTTIEIVRVQAKKFENRNR